MSVVLFRVDGPSADPSAEDRIMQVGGHCLFLKQQPKESGNTKQLQANTQVYLHTPSAPVTAGHTSHV